MGAAMFGAEHVDGGATLRSVRDKVPSLAGKVAVTGEERALPAAAQCGKWCGQTEHPRARRANPGGLR